MRTAWVGFVGAILVAPVHARTVVLLDREMTHIAGLSPNLPESGWAGIEYSGGIFGSAIFTLSPQEHGALVRFGLDRIPPGNRIVNAELILPIYNAWPTDGKVSAWRLLKEWGWGACHLYRNTLPARLEWTVPGARGNGVDRAMQPTATASPPLRSAEARLNVTQDVELWYSGIATNHGWVLTAEPGSSPIYMYAPIINGADRWQLRITYEPL